MDKTHLTRPPVPQIPDRLIFHTRVPEILLSPIIYNLQGTGHWFCIKRTSKHADIWVAETSGGELPLSWGGYDIVWTACERSGS